MKKINHKLRRFYRQNRILLLGFLTCMAAFVLMIYFSLLSYSHYRQELIATEQKQLLTMAETIGKSLVNYLEQELNSIDSVSYTHLLFYRFILFDLIQILSVGSNNLLIPAKGFLLITLPGTGSVIV